jgi:cholesterol transport system auxiliary component
MKAHHPLLLAVLLLGACSILPKAEAPDVYLLPGSPGARPRQVNAQDWSLRVQTPQASNSLDSARIAVVPGDHVLTAYQGARWSDPAPVLLRDRVLDTFRNDGRVRALSSDEENLQADYILGGALRAFQTEYQAGQPVVVIRYDAWLVRSRSQRIVATRQFELRQPSAGKAVPQVVEAFGQASDQLAAGLLAWTVQAVAAAPAPADARQTP